MNIFLRGLRKVVPRHIRANFQRYRYRVQGFQAVGDPLRVYYVDPDRIQRGIPAKNLDFTAPSFGIKDGDWDKKVVDMEAKGTTHSMFVKHFEQGVPWEDTEKYADIVSEIRDTGGAGTIDTQDNSIKEWDEYLEYMEGLYEKINREGYRPQDELSSEEDFAGRRTHPAFNEIQLFIGRNGELIIKSGVHRLAISKILDIDEVPVRTRVRHRGWQETREEINAANDLNSFDTEIIKKLKHPELQDIVPDRGETAEMTHLDQD